MGKLYFHELSDKEKREILLTKSIGVILNEYEQPKWCGKHEALNGIFGCRDLLGITKKNICKQYCSDCIQFEN